MKKILGIVISVILAMTALTACGAPAAPSPSPSAPAGSPDAPAAPEVTPADTSNFDTNADINVVSREEGSGTRGAFIELFKIEVKKEDGSKKDMTTKEADIANKTDVMMTTVANNPFAIGYSSMGSLNDTIKALKIDGVEPTSENVINGTYKISRPFNIATKGEPTGLAKDFIDFVLSKEGQEVVSKSYISVVNDAPAFNNTNVSGRIVIGGSSSVSPIIEKLKEAYLAINSAAAIEIQTTDSTAGMTGAIEGTCDIGMASRDLKDAEKEQLTPIAIALDGLAVIVNNENPLEDISPEQVRSIFVGEALSWSEVQ